MAEKNQSGDSELQSLRKELEEARQQIAGLLKDKASSTGDEVNDQVERIARQVEDALDEARQFVEKNPVTASVLSFFLGIFIARLFR
ncbi:MAG: hypothetical protein JJU36_05900 [Phycisphaeraceae bacterium]|nr:hypothetical protein [Phycisphaeraceae bacterium]